jgi:hypothetical protein
VLKAFRNVQQPLLCMPSWSESSNSNSIWVWSLLIRRCPPLIYRETLQYSSTREEEDDLNEALPLSACVLQDKKTDERAVSKFRIDGRALVWWAKLLTGGIKTTSTRSASVITKGKNVS